MQSGISASQELISEFNSLLGTPNAFALLITIESEALKPLRLLSSSSPSSTFESNLSLLTPFLEPKRALYALLRRYDTKPYLVAATYVPDAAPVRQKMLFASTRLALTRELGTEHFRDNIFATDAKELTAEGFRGMDAHAKLDAPLTEKERSLCDVKRAEADAGQGSAMKDIHLSSRLAIPMAEDTLAALRGIGREGGNAVVMLKVDAASETVQLALPPSSTPASISALTSTISTTEPRFTFFRYPHTHDGAEHNSLLFIYTNPSAAGTKAIKSRMLYPLMKRAVLETATREGVSVDKKFEVEEPAEVTEARVMEELHPQVVAKQSFSRPKRPGR